MVMFMSYNRAVIPLEACGNCSPKKKSAVSRIMRVRFYRSLINMIYKLNDSHDAPRGTTSLQLKLMSERPLFVAFAEGLKCSLKSLFKMTQKKHIICFGWYLVKVPVHYVNCVFERTESGRTEKLPVLL
jgi:hypothetical protein